MNGSWLTQAIIAMLLLIPAWLLIGFFDRNYHVRADVFLIWYFLGVVFTSVLSVVSTGSSPSMIVPSWRLVGAILVIGLTIGGIANVLLFRAVVGASNPGLPVVIANMAGVGVFFAAAVLSRWAPSYFSSVKIDAWSFLGVALAISGVVLIAIRR